MDTTALINKEVSEYRDTDIQIVPGFYFNQRRAIEKIFFYHNSKFQSGEVDDEGDRKYFYNINRNPCKIYTKAIDFDTKNIRLLTAGGGDALTTWFMERDLKYWMRDQKFGMILNRIFKELPIYGTVVLKVVDGKIYFVDLRNFIVDQGADDLDAANYIDEIHLYVPAQFKKIAKQMKWPTDKINKVLDQFYKNKNTSHIRVYERYGDVPDLQGNYTYRRTFFADVSYDVFNELTQQEIHYPGIELSSEEWEEHPYWEFHINKIPGRWLGVGVVEELFEPQIKQNEIANLQSKASYWRALVLFQTRDGGFNRNLRTDATNGEVLTADSEITQVNVQDMNLAYFNDEYKKWMNNRDELSFSYDAVQGERSPAGTPLGSTQISISQTLSYFEGIQEEIALQIKEMLYDVIIPQFEKENTPEHVIRLVGKDLDQYAAFVKNQMVMEELIRFATSGKFPTTQDKEVIELAIEESIKQGKEKLLTIPKSFYKDAKYDIDIDITGESVDTRVRYATRFALLQAITADPTMTTDPVKRKILYGMAEDGGINANDLFDTQASPMSASAQNAPQNVRAGGGVSAPALQGALPGQNSAVV